MHDYVIDTLFGDEGLQSLCGCLFCSLELDLNFEGCWKVGILKREVEIWIKG